MSRNTGGLRDPFATEDDESSSSGAGRPPPRVSRPGQAPLRNIRESSSTSPFPQAPSSSSRYIGSLGAPRSAVSRDAPSTSASGNSAQRSLALSLGLPRSRTAAAAKRENDPATTSHDDPANSASTVKQADDAVRNTDSDALLSRLSALKLGYLPSEPFTREFSTSAQSTSSGTTFSRPHHQPDAQQTRRSPLINIGTYLRCSTIDSEVERFLRDGERVKQIISIGAGSDSRYWRIMSDAALSNNLHHYVEIDFAKNTNQKLNRILRSSTLRSFLDTKSTVHGVPLADLPYSSRAASPTEDKSLDVLRSSKYTLLAADVRLLHPDTPTDDRIDPIRLFGPEDTGLREDLPTLVLFECVLAYIAPDKADWLIQVLGERFGDIQAMSYDIALAGDVDTSSRQPARGVDVDQHNEGMNQSAVAMQQIEPPSRFGRVMLQNLEMRKLSLPGAKAYPTITAQSQRFAKAWSTLSPTSSSQEKRSQVEVGGRSLFSIWSALSSEQKSRLSRLEGLDEVEEIDMLLKHYCIVQARRRRA